MPYRLLSIPNKLLITKATYVLIFMAFVKIFVYFVMNFFAELHKLSDVGLSFLILYFALLGFGHDLQHNPLISSVQYDKIGFAPNGARYLP